MWNPKWDNHATPVATPYRNEHSRPSCQPVCYNDSPIATDGLWEDSFVRATPQVSHVYQYALLKSPSLVFLHDHKRASESYRRELPTNVDPSGRNQAREYIQIPTRLRCSQPAMARNSKCPISSLTRSSPPSPNTASIIGTNHRLRHQFTVQMTRCLSATVNQPGFDRQWVPSFLRQIGQTANDAIPPTFRRECEEHA